MIQSSTQRDLNYLRGNLTEARRDLSDYLSEGGKVGTAEHSDLMDRAADLRKQITALNG